MFTRCAAVSEMLLELFVNQCRFNVYADTRRLFIELFYPLFFRKMLIPGTVLLLSLACLNPVNAGHNSYDRK